MNCAFYWVMDCWALDRMPFLVFGVISSFTSLMLSLDSLSIMTIFFLLFGNIEHVYPCFRMLLNDPSGISFHLIVLTRKDLFLIYLCTVLLKYYNSAAEVLPICKWGRLGSHHSSVYSCWGPNLGCWQLSPGRTKLSSIPWRNARKTSLWAMNIRP